MIGLAIANALRPLRFRGKGRLLGPLIPRAGNVAATIAGYRVPLDLSDEIQWEMAVGCFELAETRTLLENLGPGMVALDVGSNVGHHTLHAAHAVGESGTVIAVEPYPYAADRLEHVLRAEGLKHVRVERVALGDETGTVTMAAPLADNHTPSLLTDEPERNQIPVRIVRLDDVIDSWLPDGAVVDFAKVDIEGYESAFVRGARRSLVTGRIRTLLMEFDDYFLSAAGTSPDGLHEDVVAAGFGLEKVHRHGRFYRHRSAT